MSRTPANSMNHNTVGDASCANNRKQGSDLLAILARAARARRAAASIKSLYSGRQNSVRCCGTNLEALRIEIPSCSLS